MPLSNGEVIAGYTIVRMLGAGGMGEVYQVAHPRLPRNDALKVLSADVCADSEYRERFSREADIAAGLWHPHIVEVHDRGEHDGRLWISMDYVEGTDTAVLLRERYPHGMPPALVVRIVTAVGQALDYAHERGLLHRDVKPANILISEPETPHERIMLSDFGIARRIGEASNLTGTNMTVGTVFYSAPEQLTGEDTIDGRADQYALAATAYQLLTGNPPFQHSNAAIVISQHLTARPPSIAERRPDLSDMGGAFDKALAKSPAARFDRCVDFARALANRTGVEFSEDPEATMAARAAAGPRHARPDAAPRSRGRLLTVLALAASLIAIAAVASALFLFERDGRTPTAAGPALPVVVVGADCATLGAAGVTPSGDQAYCARLSSSGEPLWSLYKGDIAHPAGVSADEAPVQVCVEQTGKSSADCERDIEQENADPTANDKSS
ncbi:serine/threonine-protein kinase [Mycobacterium sp. C31M]